MSKMFLYNHGGSANHGCEALVRTVSNLLSNENRIMLFSEAPQQDIHYDIQKIAEIESAVSPVSKLSLEFLKAYIHLKRTGDYFEMDTLPYLKSIGKMKSGDMEISVGGDIYCYEDYPKFIQLHQLIKKRGCKSVLLGCSLEENLFDDPEFVKDMRSYDYISARESLTYNLLKEAGLTNIGLAPDSAFTLPVEKLPLPEGFIEGNTVGINLSPLVSRKETSEGIVLKNYENLIRWILNNSDCAVALIPHVVWESNDDREVLKELYEKFKDTGRVVMIPDCNCMQLKGYISRCRFFVGARTHATIAAYSTCVPTLVVGYSIKSRGIATDLFGTDVDYVIPVQNMKNEDDLSDIFEKMKEREMQIRDRLNEIMPDYIERAKDVRKKLRPILGV